MIGAANAALKRHENWASNSHMKNTKTEVLDIEPELNIYGADVTKLPVLARRRVSFINKKQRQGRSRSASFPMGKVTLIEDDSSITRPKANSQPARPQMSFDQVNVAALQDDTATEVEDITGTLDKQHISPDDATDIAGWSVRSGSSATTASRSVRSGSSATTMSELSDEPGRYHKIARRLSSTSASPVHRMVMLQERDIQGQDGSLVEDSKPQPRRTLKRRWSTTAVNLGNDDSFSAELCDLGKAAFAPNIMYS